MTAAKTRRGAVPAKGSSAKSVPPKAASGKRPPAKQPAAKAAAAKAPARKPAPAASRPATAKPATAKPVSKPAAAAKPVSTRVAVPAKAAAKPLATKAAPAKASGGRKGRGDSGSEANLHKRVDSERIAEHIAAFEKSGGRVEKLGVTKVLQRVTELAASAPAQASKTGGRRR